MPFHHYTNQICYFTIIQIKYGFSPLHKSNMLSTIIQIKYAFHHYTNQICFFTIIQIKYAFSPLYKSNMLFTIIQIKYAFSPLYKSNMLFTIIQIKYAFSPGTRNDKVQVMINSFSLSLSCSINFSDLFICSVKFIFS